MKVLINLFNEDSRPKKRDSNARINYWDDTGITFGAIIIISFLTGLARPGFAWFWALIRGLCLRL